MKGHFEDLVAGCEALSVLAELEVAGGGVEADSE
jgi:hypothetical protein